MWKSVFTLQKNEQQEYARIFIFFSYSEFKIDAVFYPFVPFMSTFFLSTSQRS
jgi:hypothetical protein